MKLDGQEQPLSSPAHSAFLSSYPDASSRQGWEFSLRKYRG